MSLSNRTNVRGAGGGKKERKYEFAALANTYNALTLKYYENDKLISTQNIASPGWDVWAWDDGVFKAKGSITIDPNHASWYVFTSGNYIVNGVERSAGTRLSSSTDLVMGSGGHQTFIVTE